MLIDVQKIISCCGFCGTFYRKEEERTMYILLFLLWVALNGKLTAEIAVFGVFIAGGVYWFMCKNLEYDPKNDIRMVKNSLRAIVYIIVLFSEIVKSSIAVMKIVFSKSVALAIQKAFPCKKVGEAVIGLEVPHAHIHLIPIQKESDMLFSNPKLSLTAEEFVSIADAINKAWVEGQK